MVCLKLVLPAQSIVNLKFLPNLCFPQSGSIQRLMPQSEIICCLAGMALRKAQYEVYVRNVHIKRWCIISTQQYSGLNQNPFIIPPIRAAQGVHLDELGGLGEMNGPQVSCVPSVSRALLLIMVHAYESTFNHEAHFKLLLHHIF